MICDIKFKRGYLFSFDEMKSLKECLKDFEGFGKDLVVGQDVFNLSYEEKGLIKPDEPGEMSRRLQDPRRGEELPYNGLVVTVYNGEVMAVCSAIFDRDLVRKLGDGAIETNNHDYGKVYPAEGNGDNLLLVELTRQFWTDVIRNSESLGTKVIYCDPVKESPYFKLAEEWGFRPTGHRILDNIRHARMDLSL